MYSTEKVYKMGKKINELLEKTQKKIYKHSFLLTIYVSQ